MFAKVTVAIFIFIMIGTAAAGLWAINAELRRSKASLLITEAQLQAAQESLSQYQESIYSLSSANDDLFQKLRGSYQDINEIQSRNRDVLKDVRRIHGQEIRELDSQNREVEASNRDLIKKLRKADVDKEDLQARNEEQAQSLQVSYEENRTLQGANDRLVTDLEDVRGENRSLIVDLDTVRSKLELSDHRYQELERQSGSVTQLEARMESLRSEIAKLETQRKPLLVRSSMGHFRCTGSMEPKITCLDSATYLKNFLPEDITVGTVISFKTVVGCSVTSGSVAHRVVKIKVENGVYYYWPKGDNNDKADGCWIPETNVAGYIIELHKNTAPQNAALRNMVNTAQSDVNKSLMDYQEKRDSYCGRGSTGTCYLPSYRIRVLDRLYEEYEIAWKYYSCSVDAAKEAIYWKEGPLYRPCFKALLGFQPSFP